MVYVTAVEAARRLGKSEKTIRRWIEEGRLAAFHPGGHKNRLAIAEQDVEQLAGELASLEGPAQPTAAEQDIATLQGHIETLERRIIQLERITASLSGPGREAAAEQKPIRTRPASSSPAETPSDIPPGSVQYFQLAKAHGVKDRTFRDQIRAGKIDALIRPKLNRPGETEYWLTPDQQQRALRYWIEHGTPHSLPLEPLEQDSSEDQEKPTL